MPCSVSDTAALLGVGWGGFYSTFKKLAKAFEPNLEVGYGRGTAVIKMAPDPALTSLTFQWRKGKSSDSDSSMVAAWLEEVQGRVMGALRGSSGQNAFRFVIVEALRASNLRGSLRS